MTTNTFVTPDGKQYDMTVINQAEDRVHEIAVVTPTKAPELMALFSRACFTLSRHLASMYLGYQNAKKATANRKAVMIIDVIPTKIAEKKLSQNDATRQAFLDLDSEYSEALDKENQFEAAVMLVKRKIEDMEGALNAVKKVLADTDGVYRRPNYNMNDVTFGEHGHAPMDVTTTSTGFKIGKPRY